MLVSILINNYNYGRYLGEAIESALAQTHPEVETIVVDDGSTDHSRAILAGYEGRVQTVLKANGGQGSAFNAGFAASRGQVIIFLDSDDVLHPGAVARIVAGWDTVAVKTHFVLTRVNDRGESIGTEPRRHRTLPDGHAWLPEGEVWRTLVERGHFLTTPTSGNAYARWALEHVMPMPEPPYRISADAYLNNCIVFHGSVQAVNEPLGLYRIHGANDSLGNALSSDIARVRYLMAREAANDATFMREVDRLELGISPEVRYRYHHRLKLRILSWKADRAHHPKPADTLRSLAWQTADAVWRASGLSLFERGVQTLWCLALLTLPPRVVLRLVAQSRKLKRPIRPQSRSQNSVSAIRSTVTS